MRAPSDWVLLSIRPQHASGIYQGTKRAELRKSFPESARLVFLYETAPVSAVTGAFTVSNAVKTSIPTAVSLASAAGVEKRQAAAYYGERSNGWVVGVGAVCRFKQSVRLAELMASHHYFAVPQTFSYLSPVEGLTQELLSHFVSEVAQSITLQPIRAINLPLFSHLVRVEVGALYEDIDDDFLAQVLEDDVGLESAFSTQAKHVLEVRWDSELVGFTVLTAKVYGAWKSGPTILLPPFRRVGLGQALRIKIAEYCRKEGAIGIYCTCAESRPAVVSYLLNSGMRIQARLRHHLSRDRDELVFSEKIGAAGSPVSQPSRRRRSHVMAIRRIRSTSPAVNRVIRDFLQLMPRWYFTPARALAQSIRTSLVALEEGVERYSSKGRTLHAAFDARGRTVAAALGTAKRSNMVKLNLVALVGDVTLVRRLISRVLIDWKEARRVYLTLPVTEHGALSALTDLGFRFEGVLTDPFGTGRDHVCLGLAHSVPSTKSRRRAVRK